MGLTVSELIRLKAEIPEARVSDEDKDIMKRGIEQQIRLQLAIDSKLKDKWADE